MKRKMAVTLSASMIVLIALSASSAVISVGAVKTVTMKIIATNLGPVHVGQGTTLFALITNSHPVSTTYADRDLMLNSYVVSGVKVAIKVNGALWMSFLLLPPPSDGCSLQDCAAHWPMTVKCAGMPPWKTPCQTIGSPAVLPGESTYIFYFAWVHGSPPSEPNGKFVFVFTVHGSRNGVSADITASSPTIKMTT